MHSPLPFVNQLHTFSTAHKALLAHAKATAVQRWQLLGHLVCDGICQYLIMHLALYLSRCHHYIPLA